MMSLGVDITMAVFRRSVGAKDEEEGRASLGTHSRFSALLGDWASCLIEGAIGERWKRCALPTRVCSCRAVPNWRSEYLSRRAL